MKHRRPEPPSEDVRTLALSLGLWANDRSIRDPTHENTYLCLSFFLTKFFLSLPVLVKSKDKETATNCLHNSQLYS